MAVGSEQPAARIHEVLEPHADVREPEAECLKAVRTIDPADLMVIVRPRRARPFAGGLPDRPSHTHDKAMLVAVGIDADEVHRPHEVGFGFHPDFRLTIPAFSRGREKGAMPPTGPSACNARRETRP